MMSVAGVASQEMSVPLKTGFLHNGQGMGNLKTCWSSHDGFENTFFNVDPITMACSLHPSAQQHCTSVGHTSNPVSANDYCFTESCIRVPPQISSSSPFRPKTEQLSSKHEDNLVPSFNRLSVTVDCGSEETPPHTPAKSGSPQFSCGSSNDRSSRPLPPLPISVDLFADDIDREVEFLTSSDTDFLLDDYGFSPFKSSTPSRRSFRGCGQINYAYFDASEGPKTEDGKSKTNLNGCTQATCPPPQQLHRRLRRSHSGPAGSFNKPVVRIYSLLNRASPNSDDKPEVPPRVPIPPRVLKPDYRRWSAEVTSSAYSDEDRPPKVPPREPLSRSNSRTPSPKSLPLYLNGVMPPTQSFAPDPKYVSSKALQRQNSEGSASRVPCILPIIENGKKASSTHYYLLPERPPYLDKYEKFFREAEETSSSTEVKSWSGDSSAKQDSKARMDTIGHVKRKHLSYVVSP